jgi:5-methylcytosine-specific restriction endonuclease McrA
LTEDGCDELLAAVSGKSRRQVEELLAKRAPRPDTPSIITPTTTTPPLPAMTAAASAPPAARPRIHPLAEDRCEVRFTASRAFCEKLERTRDLLRHRNPSGEFEQVLDPALDLLLAKLEKERLGKVKKPRRRKSGTTTTDGDIPAEVRREVFARDGEQCSFTDETGCRCTSRYKLELDHVVPRAHGGPDTVENLRVVCRPHNSLYAEKTFGREHIAEKIEERRTRKAAPTNPVAGVFDLTSRALKSMGFKEAELRRALVVLRERHGNEPSPTIESLVRDALQLLT